jgi:hyperosmotically inducible protein
LPEKSSGREGGSQQAWNSFAKLHDPFSRKGFVINQLTTKQKKGVAPMKNKNVFFRCLFLAMLIVSFAACASTSKQEGTGDYIDDSVITTKIKSQLAADDFLKSFQISVESRKGIAQLSGFVDSQKAVDKAGQIARGVEGVKSVRNDLIVK